MFGMTSTSCRKLVWPFTTIWLVATPGGVPPGPASGTWIDGPVDANSATGLTVGAADWVARSRPQLTSVPPSEPGSGAGGGGGTPVSVLSVTFRVQVPRGSMPTKAPRAPSGTRLNCGAFSPRAAAVRSLASVVAESSHSVPSKTSFVPPMAFGRAGFVEPVMNRTVRAAWPVRAGEVSSISRSPLPVCLMKVRTSTSRR